MILLNLVCTRDLTSTCDGYRNSCALFILQCARETKSVNRSKAGPVYRFGKLQNLVDLTQLQDVDNYWCYDEGGIGDRELVDEREDSDSHGGGLMVM